MKQNTSFRAGPWLAPAVAGLFFVSGAAGLIYEVAWTRMFAVVAGGTTHALTAVLVAYMSGLALGSFLAGRFGDEKIIRPILAYAVLEAGIGLFAVFSPFLIPALLPVLKSLRLMFESATGAFDFFRFLILAGVLIFPTTLMGATFPILLRGLSFGKDKFGMSAGVLYASNTFGAVSGALVSGFLLIPALGLRTTVWAAAGLNLMLLAVVLAIPALRSQTAGPEGPRPLAERKTEDRSWLLWLLLCGYGLSGLCAMVYQVGWARVLALLLGNSTYALSLILAAYIGGLFLGGALMTPLADRFSRPVLWAGLLEAAIGLSALAVMPLFEWATGRMFSWSLNFQDRFGAYQTMRFGIAFGLILLPTLCMGALFPLVVKLVSGLRGGTARPAGAVYAANTVGAILGAFLAGYLLIRLFGVEHSLRLATVLSVAVGLLWLAVAEVRSRYRPALVLSIAAAGWAGLGLIPRWDPLVMNSGPYLYAAKVQHRLKQGVSLQEALGEDKLLYHREGVEATVSVLEDRESGERMLRINGKVDASTRGDLPTEVLFGHLPLLLHPSPKKVMVLGLASGITAGSVLTHPEVERLECVEISPEVVEASYFFRETSRLNYQDPRLRLIIDDARNYLALSEARYDVIIIEPTNPWVAGLGMLWTREFYRLLADHLEPGGLVLIFFPAYDMNVEMVQMVLRTFTAVFAEVTLWESIPLADYVLIGSHQPLAVDLADLERRASHPAVAADLARINLAGVGIFANFVMGSRAVAEVAGAGDLHTDDRSQFEFWMPRLLGSPLVPRLLAIIREVLSEHEPATGIARDLDAARREQLEGFDRTRARYYRAFQVSRQDGTKPGGLERVIGVWQEVLRQCGENWPRQFVGRELVWPLLARGNQRLAQGDPSGALMDWEEAFRLHPFTALPAERLIRFHLEAGQKDSAREWAEKTLEYLPGNIFALGVLGHLAQEQGDWAEAEQRYRQALDAWPRGLEVRWNLALALMRQGKFAEAEPELRALTESEPGQAKYWSGLAYVINQQGREQEARQYLEKARRLDPTVPEAMGPQDDLP